MGNKIWRNLLKKKGMILVVLYLIISLVAYRYLPEKIGLQINLKGEMNNYVPKNLFIVMIPTILFVIDYYYSSENSYKIKGFIIELIFFTINVLFIFLNMKS